FEAVRQSQPLDRFAAEVCATNRVSRVNRKAARRALDTRLVPQKKHRSGPMATRRSGERTKRIAPAKLSPAQGGLLQICETQMTSETPLDKKRPIQGGAKRRMRAATRSGAVVPLASPSRFRAPALIRPSGTFSHLWSGGGEIWR